MAEISRSVSIKLTPEGFMMEHSFTEESKPPLPDLLVYLGQLNIPNLQLSGVRSAYQAPAGQPTCIAPLPGAPSPFQGSSMERVQPSKRPPIVRWLRPLFNQLPALTEARAVLIIDTSQAMVKVFNMAFAGAKMETLYAGQPQVFNELISKQRPDMIMMASHLGKIDGGLLAIKIRTDSRTAKVPVIMYSSPRPRHEIVRAFDCGITDYLVMPVDAVTYRSRVLKVLSQVRKTISLGQNGEGQVPAAPGGATTAKEKVIDLSQLVAKIETMLAVPHILARVLKISEDQASGAKELAQAVQSDSATAAVVLKRVNTAFYGKGEPIDDVLEAIVRIGFSETRSLVLAMSVVKQFSKEQKSNGFDRQDFWRHSLATAVLARIFARQIK